MSPKARSQVTHLGKGVHHVVLHYGFMEQPDVPRDLAAPRRQGHPVRPDADVLLRRPQQLRRAPSKPLLPRWQEKLFLTLSRFAASAGDFFGLPTNRVVELGSRIEI